MLNKSIKKISFGIQETYFIFKVWVHTIQNKIPIEDFWYSLEPYYTCICPPVWEVFKNQINFCIKQNMNIDIKDLEDFTLSEYSEKLYRYLG